MKFFNFVVNEFFMVFITIWTHIDHEYFISLMKGSNINPSEEYEESDDYYEDSDPESDENDIDLS